MRKKSGLTLIELLVAIAIIGIILSIVYLGISNLRSSSSRNTNTNIIRQSETMDTVSHDGHLWIVAQPLLRDGIHVIHHPDCKCHKTLLPENPNN